MAWVRDWVVRFVFWTQPRRRWVVAVTRWRYCPRRINAWLLDQLYPPEAGVSFGEAER